MLFNAQMRSVKWISILIQPLKTKNKYDVGENIFREFQ